MATTITSGGQEWVSEKAVDQHAGDLLYEIAVGDGTTSPSESDTSLANELYRSNDSNSDCIVEATTNTGEVRGRITVTGGSDVAGGTSVSEFGLFTSSGTMVYREVRDTAVTINDGENKTFEFTITWDNA